jgi:hypothetical protein
MKMLCLLTLLLLGAPVWAADLYPDDAGDAPSEAAAFAVGTGTVAVAGVVELDTDADWYRFTALPGIAYRVEAATAGVWDVSLELRAPDGQTLWSKTNSAFAGHPVKASISWTNPGAAGPCYIGVRGLLDFTTGSYQVAVSPLNFQDVDGDGLPDAWELQHFGALTNEAAGDNDGDDVPNLTEFYTLTQPTNLASRFAITSIAQAGGTVTVAWAAAPWARYEVDADVNLPGALWGGVTNRLRTDPAPGTEFYRVPVAGPGTTPVFRVEYLLTP